MTNLRDDARAKLGIEAGDLLARDPRLVYASGSGYGTRGPQARSRGFDYPSSWCRSRSAYVQTPPDGPPPLQPGSVGDLTGGATLARAIAAALLRREPQPAGSVGGSGTRCSGRPSCERCGTSSNAATTVAMRSATMDRYSPCVTTYNRR